MKVNKAKDFVSAPSLMLWALPVLLLFLYVLPFFGVAGWSITRPEIGLGHYEQIFTDPSLVAIFLRTLRICIVTTILTVGTGYVLSYYWVLGSPWQRRLIEISIFIPFWISVLIRAFGWVVILRTNGIANSFLLGLNFISEPVNMGRNEIAVIIGMVHFMIPFAVFPLATVMRKIDKKILLAAYGLGAQPITVFLRIFLPLSGSGIIAALIMVFVFSLGFFVTPTILGGGRVIMIAESVFVQMFQTANWGLGAALSVVLLVFVGALTWAFHKVVRIERFVS